MMEIRNVDYCMDGGTAVIDTDKGFYYVDRRLGTNTYGSIYKCDHPDGEDSIIANDVKDELLLALKNKRDGLYPYQIDVALNVLILDIKNSN